MANVSHVKSKTFAAVSADTTAICANQTNSGSGSMTLTDTGTAGVLVPGNLGTTVTIISTASDSNNGGLFIGAPFWSLPRIAARSKRKPSI